MQLVIPQKLVWLAYMGKNLCLTHWSLSFEPAHDKTSIMTCRPREDSDQPGHPPSLIRLFAWRNLESLATHWAHSEDWSDLVNAGRAVILLVLSSCGSFIILWFVSLASKILISVISRCFYAPAASARRGQRAFGLFLCAYVCTSVRP